MKKETLFAVFNPAAMASLGVLNSVYSYDKGNDFAGTLSAVAAVAFCILGGFERYKLYNENSPPEPQK